MSTSIPRTPLKQIVILGGGFGGVYTAMHLEKIFGRHRDVEITLINLPGRTR